MKTFLQAVLQAALAGALAGVAEKVPFLKQILNSK